MRRFNRMFGSRAAEAVYEWQSWAAYEEEHGWPLFAQYGFYAKKTPASVAAVAG